MKKFGKAALVSIASLIAFAAQTARAETMLLSFKARDKVICEANCGPRQSHIVTVGMLTAGWLGFSSEPLMGKIPEHLNAHKVLNTIRCDQLCFGLHGYNNVRGIDFALEVDREGCRDANSAVPA